MALIRLNLTLSSSGLTAEFGLGPSLSVLVLVSPHLVNEATMLLFREGR